MGLLKGGGPCRKGPDSFAGASTAIPQHSFEPALRQHLCSIARLQEGGSGQQPYYLRPPLCSRKHFVVPSLPLLSVICCSAVCCMSPHAVVLSWCQQALHVRAHQRRQNTRAAQRPLRIAQGSQGPCASAAGRSTATPAMLISVIQQCHALLPGPASEIRLSLLCLPPLSSRTRREPAGRDLSAPATPVNLLISRPRALCRHGCQPAEQQQHFPCWGVPPAPACLHPEQAVQLPAAAHQGAWGALQFVRGRACWRELRGAEALHQHSPGIKCVVIDM